MENKELTPTEQTELAIKMKESEHFNNNFEIAKLLPSAGTLETTEEQKKILYAPVNEEDIEIRPDGLIYAPWMEYVSRLNQAYGTSWTIIPNGNPMVKDNQVIWGFYLVIKGKLMGYAIGSQEYYPDNKKMNWTDACESAKSNCLMRLCKGLGISLELWKPSFIRKWKANFAENYQDKDKRTGEMKTFWRKKRISTALPPPSPDEPIPEPGAGEPPVNPEKPVKVGEGIYETVVRMKEVKQSKSGKIWNGYTVGGGRYTTNKKEVAEAMKMVIGQGEIKIKWQSNQQWRNILALGDVTEEL